MLLSKLARAQATTVIQLTLPVLSYDMPDRLHNTDELPANIRTISFVYCLRGDMAALLLLNAITLSAIAVTLLSRMLLLANILKVCKLTL